MFCLAVLFLAGRESHAVLFRDTGDPTYNTNAPTGALTNSGWQYEGQWQGSYLGTPIAPHYFLSAQHIGGSVGNVFTWNGVNYGTTAYFNSPDSDLRIWEVMNTFPSYAPLYTNMNSAGQLVVVIGRGTQRGGPVVINGTTNGWYWGTQDHVQRWGENTVTASYDPYLYALFSEAGSTNQCAVSTGDSAGAWFIQQGGVWALAGITYGVDVVLTPTNCQEFSASMLDERGLCYPYYPPNYPVAVPSGFVASSVANDLSWINSVIQPSATGMTPIAVTGYNANGVIESASVNPTADMAGTWTYYASSTPGAPTGTGLPMGTTITSLYSGTTQFALQPVSATDNVFWLYSNGSSDNTSATMTLSGTQAYSELSFLAAASVNGGITYPSFTINYQGGGTQTGTLNLPNWTSAGNIAYTSGVYVGNNPGSGGGFPDVSSDVNLYQINVVTTDQTDPITSIILTASNYGGGNNEMFFALSGAAAAAAPSQLSTNKFTSITRSGNNVNLSWTGIGDTINVLQASPSLNPTNFVNVSGDLNPPSSSSGKVIYYNYTDAGGATNSSRFYRVQIVP